MKLENLCHAANTLQAGSNSIDVLWLQGGMYLLELPQTNGEKVVRKMVKE